MRVLAPDDGEQQLLVDAARAGMVWYGMVWYGMVVLGTGGWIINFNQGRIRERREETRVMDKG